MPPNHRLSWLRGQLLVELAQHSPLLPACTKLSPKCLRRQRSHQDGQGQVHPCRHVLRIQNIRVPKNRCHIRAHREGPLGGKAENSSQSQSCVHTQLLCTGQVRHGSCRLVVPSPSLAAMSLPKLGTIRCVAASSTEQAPGEGCSLPRAQLAQVGGLPS